MSNSLRAWGAGLFAAIGGLLSAQPVAAVDYPPAPTAWFVDRAGLISPGMVQALDHRLEALEGTNGVRLVIYIDRRLPADSALEDYTLGAVESWKVWRKDQPAVAFFVFSEDRKMRIEVGYGAEGAVTDLEARRILDEVVTPAFRRGDFEGGLARAITALDQALRGELPPAKKGRRSRDGVDFVVIITLLLIYLFVVQPLLRRRGFGATRRRGPGGPWILGGSGPGRGSWGGGGGFGSGGFSGGGSVFGGGGASGSW